MNRIIEIPRSFTPTGLDADRLAILAADLLWRTSLTEERRRGFYIPFGRKQAYPLLGSKYSDIVRQAQSVGLVERNERYHVGAFSKSIRLTKRHRDGQTRSYALRRRRKCRSLIRIRQSDEVGSWLAGKFDAFRLNVDTTGLSPWSRFAANRFATGQHFAVRCEYGRFHSTFTSLKRSLRKKITVAGCNLVEADIANCQPLILGLNLVAHLKSRHIWYRVRAGSDVEWFLRCCVDGVLYDLLVELAVDARLTFHSFVHPKRWGRIVDRPVRRNDVKRAFILMMFADSETTRRIALYETFNRHFPTVSRFMDEVKEGGYQKLAQDCQRMESRLMIDTAVRSLMRDYPDMPLFTVHDSVATSPEYADVAADAIRSAFQPYGVCPSIHQKGEHA